MNTTFSFFKEDNKWIVESKNGDEVVERTEHGSRNKAVLSFFIRHPGITSFELVIGVRGFDGDGD